MAVACKRVGCHPTSSRYRKDTARTHDWRMKMNNKYPCPCGICKHDHRWWIGYIKCQIEHAFEYVIFGDNLQVEYAKTERLLRQKETELAAARKHST